MNTYVKKRVISSVAPVVAGSRIHRLFRKTHGGVGHILMLHRVLPESKGIRIHNHESLEISPEHLERIITTLKRKGYAFYSVEQFYQKMQEGNFERPFVVVTFDDGYLDNYEYAYPILKKHNVPFTIYVATSFPDKQIILWWYMLEELLLENDELEFTLNQQTHHFPCKTIAEKEAAFSRIRSLIHLNFKKREFSDQLAEVFGKLGKDVNKHLDKVVMTWDQIREISQDPIVTIGAHTVNHFPLIRLSQEDLIYEISRSRDIIEGHIGQEVDHFAYPFGKKAEASLREFQAVEACGFKSAVTTRQGNIFPQHVHHMQALPRVTINRVTSEQVLDLQLNGFLPFCIHKGKRLITD